MKKFILTILAAGTACAISSGQSVTKSILLPTPEEGFEFVADMTYRTVSNDEGDAIKNGPLTIKGSTDLHPNNYTRVKASYNFTANYTKGKLNGAIKGTGSTYYKGPQQSGSSTYSLSGNFVNGVPTGNFIASYKAGTTYAETVNVTYKSGKLTGSYKYDVGKTKISGTISGGGQLTGIWKWGSETYVFQNGILIKQISDDKSTPTSLQQIAQKLASKSISVEQLEKEGYICVNHSFEFGREMRYILSNMYGLPDAGGYEFPEPYEISYIEVKRPVTFTDAGFQRFLKYYKMYCDAGFDSNSMRQNVGNEHLSDILHRSLYHSDALVYRDLGEQITKLSDYDNYLGKNARGKYVTVANIVGDTDTFKDYKPYLLSRGVYYGPVYLTDDQVDAILPMRDSAVAAVEEAARIAAEKAAAEKAAAEAAAAAKEAAKVEGYKQNILSTLDYLVQFSSDKKLDMKLFGVKSCIESNLDSFMHRFTVKDSYSYRSSELAESLSPLIPLASYEVIEYSDISDEKYCSEVKCKITVGYKKKAKNYTLYFKTSKGQIDFKSISLEE